MLRSSRENRAFACHDSSVRWFEQLFGFAESSWETTQSRFTCEGTTLLSHANGRQFEIGTFEVPTVASLRARVGEPSGATTVRHEAIGDVLELHAAPQNRDAMFQAASQLNCLEFMGPDQVPEHGVTDYDRDPTQGPACALAAGAATVYRNYFVPVGEARGQRRDRQLDTLADALALLGPAEAFVTVRNGYAFSDRVRLRGAAPALAAVGRDAFIGQLRIGVHARTPMS